MPDKSTILIILSAAALVLPILFGPVRWILNARASNRFTGEGWKYYALAYAGKTEEIRREGRAALKALVERGVGSRNKYINNGDVAELLKSYVDGVVDGPEADQHSDASEARAWRAEVAELLRPMLSKPRLPRKPTATQAGGLG